MGGGTTTQMLSTLKAFQTSLKSWDPEPQTTKDASSQEGSASSRGSRRRAETPKSLLSQDSEEEDESEAPEQGFSDEGVLDSQDEEEEDSRSSKHIFSADNMEALIRAIYASEEILEPTAQVSAQNKMYRGLVKPQARVLLVHSALKVIILREWKEPERKLLKYKTWKCRCPFKEEDEKFFKTPRLDASLAQVSKQSDLSFEDTGNIKDRMDRRAETILRRALEANAVAMSPALGSACIARNADMWISNRPRILDLQVKGSPRFIGRGR